MKQIKDLKDKLLGYKERSDGETDESIIKDLIVKFNNNREGILTSKGLKGKYFTEAEHIELVGTINKRLSQLMQTNPKEYESLVQTITQIYKDEIDKYYAFSYDRDDAQSELDIDSTREHLKPYEDFLMEHERNLFDLSDDEKDKVFSTIRNISQTTYYDMNEYHSISHIQKVILFSEILAKNESLSSEETEILLASAAFHDSGRDGEEGENDNHAIESARKVLEYFEANPNNPFGIKSDNIAMIQAVIEYHEHKEREKGVTDYEKLRELGEKYKIDYEKYTSLEKISSLLKDADALDRARFGRRNENRWSLDTKFLHCDTAKSISMIRFSEECNHTFEGGEKRGLIGPSEDEVVEIFERELNKFNSLTIQQSTIAQKGNVINSLKNIQARLQKLFEDFNK